MGALARRYLFTVHLRRPDKPTKTYCGRNTAAPIECLPDGDTLAGNEQACANCLRSKTRRAE